MYPMISVVLAAGSAAPPAVAPPPREVVARLQERCRSFQGKVMAVDQSAVVVTGVEPGVAEVETTRRYRAAGPLAAGRWDPAESRGDTYRLADVRVGDRVYLRIAPDGDEDVCRAVSILRRPGGRVPPAPGEPADAAVKHHEVVNARQDHEEFGDPLPEFLDPEKRKERAARNQRETEEIRRQEAARLLRDRTAPPPREVPPKP